MLVPLAIAAALAVPAAEAAQAPQTPQAEQPAQPMFRSGADVVTLDVSVKSGDAAVSGLAAADFEVTDNGVVQKIDAVTLETLPIDVTLLLDVSGSVDGAMLDRLKASVRETAALLRPIDRVRLIAVHETIDQVFDWQPGGTPPSVDVLSAGGGTALLDGLVAAMIHPGEPDGAEIIVALTDGEDTLSILDRDALKERALRSDAVVDIVTPMPRITTTPALGRSLDVASRTGGQVFRILLKDCWATRSSIRSPDFRTSYVLGRAAGAYRAGWA